MFEDEIANAATLYNVPESWIRAVIETESNWIAQAFRSEPRISDASYGLMQLLYRTAKGLGYTGMPEGLYDPFVNIDLGTKLLGQLRALYGDDFQRVYSAYNSGSPDLWQTSSQVAANVARAVQSLTKWLSTEFTDLTKSPQSNTIVGLLVLVMVWVWAGKKGKK